MEGNKLNFCDIASNFGYCNVSKVSTFISLSEAIDESIKSSKSSFIEVSCRKGHREDLGRPDRTPRENIIEFVSFLKD